MAHHVGSFPKDGFRMTFTDNHDKNSWSGTQFTNFGKGLEACMVLACTVEGMPLVYNGQEAGMNKQLAFFEKDSIEWKKHEFFDIYKKLFALKHQNQALWNGAWVVKCSAFLMINLSRLYHLYGKKMEIEFLY
jgi:hypothetical protein